MLVALACTQRTTRLYESLPLFLVCHWWGDAYLLARFSHVAAFVLDPYYLAPMMLETMIASRWPVFPVTLRSPAIIMVLRPVRAADLDHIATRGTE